MTLMLDPLVASLIAFGGVALFAWAAMHKLRTREAFVATLEQYRLLPRQTVGIAAIVLAAMELATAGLLLWPTSRFIGAATGAVLLVIYASAIAINLARGRGDLDCGCGLQPRVIGGWMVARNLIVAASLALLWLPTSGRAIGAADLATIAAALLIGALLYSSIELLLGRAVPRDLFSAERS